MPGVIVEKRATKKISLIIINILKKMYEFHFEKTSDFVYYDLITQIEDSFERYIDYYKDLLHNNGTFRSKNTRRPRRRTHRSVYSSDDIKTEIGKFFKNKLAKNQTFHIIHKGEKGDLSLSWDIYSDTPVFGMYINDDI